MMNAIAKYSLFLLLIPSNTMAQKAWDSWDSEIVTMLYTSRNRPYMTEEEKKVVLFMNMARYDGSLFADSFLDVWVDENKAEKSKYLRSLYRDLASTSGLDPLIPEQDLTSIAQEHATVSGQSGHTGHKNINNRFAPVKGNPYSAWGENCSYGFEAAIDIVISLLIDEGISNLGHRKNILNSEFNSIGVAIRPHKSYHVNCVMDFGKKNRSRLNSVPYSP